MARGAEECAYLEITVGLPVKADNRKQARRTAERKLNGRNIRIGRIELADEAGERYAFRVKEVKYVHWFHLQSSPYSGMYRVLGRVELALVPADEQGSRPLPRCTDLRLRKTRFLPYPVLMIPTSADRPVVQVHRQVLKWVVGEGRRAGSPPIR